MLVFSSSIKKNRNEYNLLMKKIIHYTGYSVVSNYITKVHQLYFDHFTTQISLDLSRKLLNIIVS